MYKIIDVFGEPHISVSDLRGMSFDEIIKVIEEYWGKWYGLDYEGWII